MQYLIGVDLGTSGVKTVLFDETGAALASRSGVRRCGPRLLVRGGGQNDPRGA